jgi:hypothetical protein
MDQLAGMVDPKIKEMEEGIASGSSGSPPP